MVIAFGYVCILCCYILDGPKIKISHRQRLRESWARVTKPVAVGACSPEPYLAKMTSDRALATAGVRDFSISRLIHHRDSRFTLSLTGYGAHLVKNVLANKKNVSCAPVRMLRSRAYLSLCVKHNHNFTFFFNFSNGYFPYWSILNFRLPVL